MIVQRFLAWAPTAPAPQRAEAAGALARAYLYSGLSRPDFQAAEAALTMLLDDPSVDVRRNISEALAASPFAPRHIIRALAHDVPEVALPVLIMSPVLDDNELINLIPVRGEEEQSAIAARNPLSPSVAAAIAEIGTPMACAVLARNVCAALTRRTFARLSERHGDDPSVRDALLERSDLPVTVRQSLLVTLAGTLGQTAVSRFSLNEERVRQMTQDACERATLLLAEVSPSTLPALVTHLRESGQLTTALLLRALLNGDLDFVRAAFVELTGLDAARVRSFFAEPYRAGFRALYRDAGLPSSAFAPFCEAVAAWAELRECGIAGASARRHAAERALAKADTGDIAGPAELLRRMVTEAAREEAIEALRPYIPPRLTAA